MFNISTIENLSNCLRKTKLREVIVNNEVIYCERKENDYGERVAEDKEEY